MMPWVLGGFAIVVLLVIKVIRDAQKDDLARKKAPKRRAD